MDDKRYFPVVVVAHLHGITWHKTTYRSRKRSAHGMKFELLDLLLPLVLAWRPPTVVGGLFDPVASPPFHVPRVGPLMCGSDPIHFGDWSTGRDTEHLVLRIKLSLKVCEWEKTKAWITSKKRVGTESQQQEGLARRSLLVRFHVTGQCIFLSVDGGTRDSVGLYFGHHHLRIKQLEMMGQIIVSLAVEDGKA